MSGLLLLLSDRNSLFLISLTLHSVSLGCIGSLFFSLKNHFFIFVFLVFSLSWNLPWNLLWLLALDILIRVLSWIGGLLGNAINYYKGYVCTQKIYFFYREIYCYRGNKKPQKRQQKYILFDFYSFFFLYYRELRKYSNVKHKMPYLYTTWGGLCGGACPQVVEIIFENFCVWWINLGTINSL